MSTLLARRVASTPVRTAAQTWATIVEIIAPDPQGAVLVDLPLQRGDLLGRPAPSSGPVPDQEKEDEPPAQGGDAAPQHAGSACEGVVSIGRFYLEGFHPVIHITVRLLGSHDWRRAYPERGKNSYP